MRISSRDAYSHVAAGVCEAARGVVPVRAGATRTAVGRAARYLRRPRAADDGSRARALRAARRGRTRRRTRAALGTAGAREGEHDPGNVASAPVGRARFVEVASCDARPLAGAVVARVAGADAPGG